MSGSGCGGISGGSGGRIGSGARSGTWESASSVPAPPLRRRPRRTTSVPFLMGSSNRRARCKPFLNSSPARAHDSGRGSLADSPDRSRSFARHESVCRGRIVFAVDIGRHRMDFRRPDARMWTAHSAYRCAGASHQTGSSCPRPGRDVSGRPGRMRTVVGRIRSSRRGRLIGGGRQGSVAVPAKATEMPEWLVGAYATSRSNCSASDRSELQAYFACPLRIM